MSAPRTLAEAAAAYCEARELADALTRSIATLGPCQVREDYEPDTGWPGVAGCYESQVVPFWQATPEQVAQFCEPCRSKLPLRIERYKARKRLSGLMRSLRVAYRRERAS